MSESQESQEKVTSKIVKLDESFGNHRLEWTKKIKDLAEDLKHGSNLPEVASYTLSYRQILVENLASLSSKIRAQKAKIDKAFKEAWIRYFQYDYKLTDTLRDKFIKADLSEDLQIQDLLETQREFTLGTIKTLDNLSFAIKQRMDMKQL